MRQIISRIEMFFYKYARTGFRGIKGSQRPCFVFFPHLLVDRAGGVG